MIELNQLRIAMKDKPAVDMDIIVIMITFSGLLISWKFLSSVIIVSYSGVNPK